MKLSNIIISGDQAVGKSTLALELCNGRKSTHFINIQEFNPKELREGCEVVVIEELNLNKEKELSLFKELCSKQTLVFRPYYAKANIEIPAPAVIACTNSNTDVLYQHGELRHCLHFKLTNPKTMKTKEIDYSKVENQVGCGYCANEVGCVLKQKGKNMAKLGCEKWLHFSLIKSQPDDTRTS